MSFGFAQSTRNFLDLFGRFGDPRRNLRGVADWAQPVVVADRFRDDDEGSVYGIQAFTPGAANEFSSVAFGSAVNDWDCLAFAIEQVGGGVHQFDVHLFTPIAPYNPVVNLNPVGLFQPGLITDRAFTFRSVQGVGGTAPTLPAIFGPLTEFFTTNSTGRSSVNMWREGGFFNPPIRIYKDVTLCLQQKALGAGGARIDMTCSILYVERPKASR